MKQYTKQYKKIFYVIHYYNNNHTETINTKKEIYKYIEILQKQEKRMYYIDKITIVPTWYGHSTVRETLEV